MPLAEIVWRQFDMEAIARRREDAKLTHLYGGSGDDLRFSVEHEGKVAHRDEFPRCSHTSIAVLLWLLPFSQEKTPDCAGRA